MFPLLLLLVIKISSAQVSGKLPGNPCISKETCGDCIAGNPECAWCSQENSTLDGRGRCDYTNNLRSWCDNDRIAIPSKDPEDKVTGNSCECESYSCDGMDGKICGGPDQGKCECGECMCKPGWAGSDCSCRNTTETCLAPNGEICSGHGDCKCGICLCHKSEEMFFGAFCEDCATCPSRCDEYRDCVECQVYPDDTDEKCAACPFISIGVDQDWVFKVEDNEKLCVYRDDRNCAFSFKYKLDDEYQPIVHAQRKKVCSSSKKSIAGKMVVPLVWAIWQATVCLIL